jgi:replicative DNA helicase
VISSPDRIPPHSRDAEEIVIGCALVYGERAMANALGLRSDEFFAPYHRDAWDAIAAAAAKPSGLMDPVTCEAEVRVLGTSQHFPDGWVTWALGVSTRACIPEQVEHFATIVREAAAARRLIELCAEVINRAYAATPWPDLLTAARTGIADLENVGVKMGTVHVSEAIAEYVEDEDRRARGEQPETITTSIASLDEILGEIEGGELVLIAGRPGKGKTSLALNIIAANALRMVPGLMFSLEMRARKLARRLLIWQARVSGNQLRGTIDLAAWKKITAAAGDFADAPLWINAKINQLQQIVAESRSWYARRVQTQARKRGMIVVDYAQLVRVTRARGGNREQEVAQISGAMKSLAMELGIPVFLLCQLSREIEKRGGPPMLSDLRESGSLEQDADRVLFPHDNLKPEDLAGRNQRRPGQIIIGKNRDGAIGAAEVTLVPELMAFLSATEESDARPNWTERGDRDRDG